jgi:hypothetical protein
VAILTHPLERPESPQDVSRPYRPYWPDRGPDRPAWPERLSHFPAATVSTTERNRAPNRRWYSETVLDGRRGVTYILIMKRDTNHGDEIMTTKISSSSDRRSEILAALSDHNHGDGCLGVIVDAALAADPNVSIDSVRSVCVSAEEDSALERERESAR